MGTDLKSEENRNHEFENKAKKYKVSNSTLWVLISLCILILVGDGFLKSYNRRLTRQLIEDHPEAFHSTSSQSVSTNDTLSFTSKDGTISFSYLKGWDVKEIEQPLQISVISPDENDACVIVCTDENVDPAIRISQTAEAYKLNCKKYVDVTGLTKCTIANIPAIRKNIDVIVPNMTTQISVSIIGLSVNGKFYSLSETTTSQTKLKNTFSLIEKSFSINN